MIVTLTLFISPPQFTLALEAALHGFHGSRKFSYVLVVPSLGLVFPLPPVFDFNAILVTVISHSTSFVEFIVSLGLLSAQTSFRHPRGSPLCEV